MECPYLEAGTVHVCGASTRMMETTRDDEEEYCATEEHYRCPMLLSYVLRGGNGDLNLN
ncbi:MAG: hypothetical protein HY954_09560 [Deltaproteobacteria bacterium]|nr:hypothetical protein [Deltaproteobacteria bacterium]